METTYKSSDLIGVWRAPDNVSGKGAFVTIEFRANGTLAYEFIAPYDTSHTQSRWQYDEATCKLEEKIQGETLHSVLEWIDEDYFILHIVDNGSAEYKGTQRHYRRATGLLSVE